MLTVAVKRLWRTCRDDNFSSLLKAAFYAFAFARFPREEHFFLTPYAILVAGLLVWPYLYWKTLHREHLADSMTGSVPYDDSRRADAAFGRLQRVRQWQRFFEIVVVTDVAKRLLFPR